MYIFIPAGSNHNMKVNVFDVKIWIFFIKCSISQYIYKRNIMDLTCKYQRYHSHRLLFHQ